MPMLKTLLLAFDNVGDNDVFFHAVFFVLILTVRIEGYYFSLCDRTIVSDFSIPPTAFCR